MRRLRVMQFLCCLSLMLCVTCSEAFSIKASALKVSPDATNDYYLLPFNDIAVSSTHVVGTFNENQGVYNGTGSLSGSTYLTFTDNGSGGVFPSVVNGHRYLLFYTCSLLDKFDFNRIILRSNFADSSSTYSLYPLTVGSLIYSSCNYVNNTTTISGIIDFTSNKTLMFSTASAIQIETNKSIVSNGRASWGFYLLDVTQNTQQQIDSIITAIQNQTSQLGSAIGGAADQVTDKIDEVLTPEGSHNFDEVIGDVNDKINENMGALGFAHDTVAQFADLFTETPGAPVITVPPLKMSIKGQEYEFFHGYQYDFRSLETGPLAILVAAVRTAGTIVLWLAFLSYCSKEFNNFFRR